MSPGYFSVLRMPIDRGRGFTGSEATAGARVAIVSAATARQFWPGADPIGKTIHIETAEGRPVDDLPGYSYVTVVGTTVDAVSGLIVDGVDQGHIYLPASASDSHVSALLVRGRTDPEPRPEVTRRTVPPGRSRCPDL